MLSPSRPTTGGSQRSRRGWAWPLTIGCSTARSAAAGWATTASPADLTTGNSISIGSNTRTGWLAGAGIEWAVTNNWTVKVEYDYLGLGSASFIVPAGTLLPLVLTGDTFGGHRNVQEFKIGFNYLFNWGAPLAPPY
jgi:outer membrane immunogenic protein